MPELPEVQTTVDGINECVKGLKIKDIWTNYSSPFHAGKDNIKNPHYFIKFKKEAINTTVINATRRGKNILVHLSGNKTILIHMKMTGHLMYGKYEYNGKEWEPIEKTGPLRDPFNKFIHLVFVLSNKYHLAFSDLRRFAKVYIFDTKNIDTIPDLSKLGLEPLATGFTLSHFKEQLMKKPRGKIKQVLMEQSLITGIGNIYSDEILWEAGVHPTSHPNKIPENILKKMFKSTQKILKKGIDFGGDSMSDYRNIRGERGAFQNKHNAYRKTGDLCPKKDHGTIHRLKIGGRSAHFCSIHQKKYI